MTVEQLLGRMLGPRAACACAAPGSIPASTLHPLEAESITGAAPRRRLEMAAGRAAARAALARLGVACSAIPRRPGGEPGWPEGVVGSITHTRALAAAVVARAASLVSVGVDAEPDAPLEEELWPAITTERELAELRALPRTLAGDRARALFCAKEATYKCQYPMTGLLLDFGDLEIQLIGGGAPVGMDAEFGAIFRRDPPPLGAADHVRGRIGRAGGHVLATAALAAPRSAS